MRLMRKLNFAMLPVTMWRFVPILICIEAFSLVIFAPIADLPEFWKKTTTPFENLQIRYDPDEFWDEIFETQMKVLLMEGIKR